MDKNQKNQEFKVAVDRPYPPVKAEERRPDYAYAMLGNVGSSNSEMSAVSLYFYNSVLLNPEYTEFARCFHEVSIVEMHHLHIFATFAYQMGLDPKLWSLSNGQRAYWSPAWNHYPRKIREVIENSIKGEEDTIKKYKRQAETIRDANIVENLNRIILDEEHHIEVFHTMLAGIL